MWYRTTISLEIIILISNALQWDNCEKIECGASGSNVCTDYSNEILKIGSCDSGYECPDQAIRILTEENEYYESHDCESVGISCETNLGAGQSCCDDSKCASENCENGKCVGKDGGEYCTFSPECKAGYWCDNRTCTEVTAKLGDPCTYDIECPAGSGCNNEICTKMFSLDTGQFSEASYFCKSRYAVRDQCDELIVKVDGEQVEEPFPCNIGQMCQYIRVGDEYMLHEFQCPCNGIEGATQSNCFFLREVKGNRGWIYETMQFDSSTCSGVVPHAYITESAWKDCGHYTDQQVENWKAELQIRDNWPLYLSGVIDGCAKDIGLFDPNKSLQTRPDTGSDTDQNTDQDTDQNTDQDTDQNTDQNTDQDADQDVDQDTGQDTGSDTGSGSGSGSGNDNSAFGLTVGMLLTFTFQLLVQYSYA